MQDKRRKVVGFVLLCSVCCKRSVRAYSALLCSSPAVSQGLRLSAPLLGFPEAYPAAVLRSPPPWTPCSTPCHAHRHAELRAGGRAPPGVMQGLVSHRIPQNQHGACREQGRKLRSCRCSSSTIREPCGSTGRASVWGDGQTCDCGGVLRAKALRGWRTVVDAT